MMKRNTTRHYREFIKDDKAIREDITKLQQKGGETNPQFEHHIQQNIENYRSPKEEIKETEVKKEERNLKPQDKSNDKSELNKKRARNKQLELEHDMVEQALGQIYDIPGANIDYDEINKMSRNNIRDTSELVNESLQNDGFTSAVQEVEKILSNYIHGESTDVSKIQKLNEEYHMDAIATAYIDIAKESTARDLPRLDKIREICRFEHPAYEKLFDRIRETDHAADMILDSLDRELGIER